MVVLFKGKNFEQTHQSLCAGIVKSLRGLREVFPMFL